MPAINQPIEAGYYTCEASVLKASAVVPYGTLAMQVSGKIRPAITGVAGSVLLGVSFQSLNETTAADVTLSSPAIFGRGMVVEMDGKSGDLPTASLLGAAVYIEDGSTVKATAATDDLSVTLVGIRGSTFMVRLP